MVGNPKSLVDLRKIDAAIKVSCHDCGQTTLIDRESLITRRTAARETLDWDGVRSTTICPCCASRNVTVLPMPFAQNDKSLRRWRAETVLINLALTILLDAAHKSNSGAVGTVEVRLALRVLHPFLRDENLLRAYWQQATEDPRHPWTSCHQPYRWITTRLLQHGFSINSELRG